MSVWSLTLAIALSVALGSIVALSVWSINDVLDDRREAQIVFSIAIAYRDHMTSSRCTLPTTALTLSAVRSTLSGAGHSFAAVEDESNWRITFEGGINRQATVSLYRLDSSSTVTNSYRFHLPVPGGDRSHELFDAVFASRICP